MNTPQPKKKSNFNGCYDIEPSHFLVNHTNSNNSNSNNNNNNNNVIDLPIKEVNEELEI